MQIETGMDASHNMIRPNQTNDQEKLANRKIEENSKNIAAESQNSKSFDPDKGKKIDVFA